MDVIQLATNLIIIGSISIAIGILVALRQHADDTNVLAENSPPDEAPALAKEDIDYVLSDGEPRSIRELEFFARLSSVPEEFTEFLLPELGSHFHVPASNNAVGELNIDVASRYFRVRVGEHIDHFFQSPHKAAEFISDILNDYLVFHITPDETNLYHIEEFKSPSEADHNYYLWSGPLFPKLLFHETD